jgi:hypothetical protein
VPSVLFFIYFVNSASNIENRKMLCDVDLMKVSTKRKVVIIVFEMLLWRRFPVNEFSVEI